MTFGPNTDRLPKYSPDGQQIAFLSDRHQEGDFQLFLLDPVSGAARATTAVSGWVEYLHWSPDGKKILLGVAGHGAELAGAQGAVATRRESDSAPSWAPTVEMANEDYRWRRICIYELDADRVREVHGASSNVWEAAWCGNEALVAVVSLGPSEGLWYSAALQVIAVETGNSREVYRPRDQLGWPAASPCGRYIAVVEAVCSDRWIVAGDLRLIDARSGAITQLDTRSIDITFTEWRSDRHLLLAGHRGFETVVALYDVASDAFSEIWSSQSISSGGRYAAVSGFGEAGDCVLISEGFLQAPQLAVIRRGQYGAAKSFDIGYAERVTAKVAAELVRWKADDDLNMQGWLLRPLRAGPHPLVMCVHGGPVWHWRPQFLGRSSLGLSALLMLEHGYAVFFPNPRGSSARGQQFARHVVGDMGGADARDCLSGLDALIERGIADPKRLGVTGGSYGGFMTSWLVTQDQRFAAAVSLAPVTNQVSEHLLSNVPHFVSLFLADTYRNPSGKYFERSPIMHAHKTRTPVLNVCGALDRITPPAEAIQFHHALLEHGVESVLVTYPEEGHGIRKLPAVFDYAARVVDWFEAHMPATRFLGGGRCWS